MSNRDRRQETWKASDVKCPFYVKDNSSIIECEGVLPDTTAALHFKAGGVKNHHMGVHCAGRFDGCPQYKSVLENKYAD